MYPARNRAAGPVALALLLVVPAFSPAQTITSAVKEGDAVAGVGNVTAINNLAVNGLGEWIVEVDTDNPDTNADGALVKNGALHLREGDALPAPAGATLDTFDSVNLNNNGDSGWNFFLDGTMGTGDDSGIYLNTALVLQEGTVSGSSDFSPGTPYIGFFEATIDNNNSDQILVVASVDDPAIPSTVDRALVVLDIDAAGNLLAENVRAKEGDILSGQVEGVNDFGTGPHQVAFNDAGDVMFFADVGTNTATDGTIYINDTLLAQEGSSSPVDNRNYELLSSRGLDLSNDNGHHVHKANLDGDTADDEVIILDGAVFRREGDTIPPISPFQLTSFGTGSGPVQVDHSGRVLWYGDWDDPNTDVDTGLFLGDQLLVQEGVTTIDGLIVDTIANGQDAFQMSENGLYVIFEATLVGGISGAFVIEIQSPVSVESLVPAARIAGVVPNPFVGVTEIRFDLDRAGTVDLTIVDVTGRRVRGFESTTYGAGRHAVAWDGRDGAGRPVPAGVYFARLGTNGARETRKLTLLGR